MSRRWFPNRSPSEREPWKGKERSLEQAEHWLFLFVSPRTDWLATKPASRPYSTVLAWTYWEATSRRTERVRRPIAPMARAKETIQTGRMCWGMKHLSSLDWDDEEIHISIRPSDVSPKLSNAIARVADRSLDSTLIDRKNPSGPRDTNHNEQGSDGKENSGQ